MRKAFSFVIATGFMAMVSSCGNESRNNSTVTDTAKTNSTVNSTNSTVNNSLDTSRINDSPGRDTMRHP